MYTFTVVSVPFCDTSNYTPWRLRLLAAVHFVLQLSFAHAPNP